MSTETAPQPQPHAPDAGAIEQPDSTIAIDTDITEQKEPYKRPEELQKLYDKRKQDQVQRIVGNMIERAQIIRPSDMEHAVIKINDDTKLLFTEDRSVDVVNSEIDEEGNLNSTGYGVRLLKDPNNVDNTTGVRVGARKTKYSGKQTDNKLDDKVINVDFTSATTGKNGLISIVDPTKLGKNLESIPLKNSQIDTVAVRSLSTVRSAVAKAEIAQSEKADKIIDEVLAKS